MKKLLVSATALFLSLASIAPARAQDVTDLPEGDQQAVSIDMGLDSGVTTRAAYTRRLPVSAWGHDLMLFGGLAVPDGGWDPGDLAVDLGLRVTPVSYGNLRLQVELGPVFRSTSNPLFEAYSVGGKVTLLPGYQSARWGLMAEIGYEKMVATYISNQPLYREIVYDDARNGWYADTAGNLLLGLRGGYRIGSVQLSARLGLTTTERGTEELLPFYGTLGLSYSF